MPDVSYPWMCPTCGARYVFGAVYCHERPKDEPYQPCLCGFDGTELIPDPYPPGDPLPNLDDEGIIDLAYGLPEDQRPIRPPSLHREGFRHIIEGGYEWWIPCRPGQENS